MPPRRGAAAARRAAPVPETLPPAVAVPSVASKKRWDANAAPSGV